MTASSTSTFTCCHCGTALSALSRIRGAASCDASPCRHRVALAHTDRLKQALVTLAQAQEPHAQVVWLKHCEPQMVAVTAEDRSGHRDCLEAMLADGYILNTSALAPSTADDSYPQGARLCAQCKGSCCEHGAGWRAFIDLTLLQRWQAHHPQSTMQDAVKAYVEMLPPSHVYGSCLYQSDQGCAMPRQHRADICNGFACDALQATQRAAAADSHARVVAITFHQDRVERAAVISAATTQALPLQ